MTDQEEIEKMTTAFEEFEAKIKDLKKRQEELRIELRKFVDAKKLEELKSKLQSSE